MMLPKWAKSAMKRFFRRQTIFLTLVLTSVVIGLAIGCYLNPSVRPKSEQLSKKDLYYLELPGKLFIRMMKLLVVPLAICANISSLSSMQLKSAGYMGCLTVACFLLSMLLAAIEGVVLAIVIKPGTYGNTLAEARRSNVSLIAQRLGLDETMISLLLNLVPENLIEAGFVQRQLHLNEPSNATTAPYSSSRQEGEANIFGLLAFSILFGIGVQSIGDKGSQVAAFFNGCREALVWVVSLLIWYFPIGVASMVASRVAETSDLSGAVVKVSMYVVTMILGLSLHFLLLNVLYLLVTHRSPFGLLKDMIAALICAVGTASSAATMPITLKCLRRASNSNVDVVQFLLPLGTTLNMNGTAVLQTVAPIFLLQSYGRSVGTVEACLTVFSGVLATMATGTMPSGALITIIITLDALNVPSSLASLIIPVDWFIDRLRTPINVYGNAVANGVVSHYIDRRETRLEHRIPSTTKVGDGNTCKVEELADSGFQEDFQMLDQVVIRF